MDYLVTVLRLMAACILGGIIGYEREHTNRPAGFRTHILVCVGAALVMITSEYIFKIYSGSTNIDPARLGAQVISGIGFLGAGTIIREGINVRGLTTAASLWAVSCVGIAVGIGFYEGAIATTILIYLTLIVLKKIEYNFTSKNLYKIFIIEADEISQKLGAISQVFQVDDIVIKSIDFISDELGENKIAKILVKFSSCKPKNNIFESLYKIDGVRKVYEE